MLRQRLRTRTPALAVIGRVLVGLLACALVFYGAMLLLLSLKLPASAVNGISGFRDTYDYLAGLGENDLTDTARYIAGGAGLLAFFVFGYLAYKEVPRPYAARRSLDLTDAERGATEVSPRAIERVAESASFGNRAVSAAAGRWEGEDLHLDVHVARARELPATLGDVQDRVRGALGEHDLPEVPVAVTLTGFDHRQPGRDVS